MRLFIFMVMILFLSSCQEKIPIGVIPVKLTEDSYPDTTWFSECEIIFPETTDQSLINIIKKIVVTPERIFIHNLQDQKLLLFSRQGKFVKSIYPIGRGPGEWLGMTDFTIDEKTREIIITADRPYKFLYYDYNGNFLREKISGAFYFEIAQTDSHILATNSKALDPKHYLSLLKETDYKITVTKKIPLEFTYLGDFRCRGSYLLKSQHLYFTQNIDYTIYRWENNRVNPLFKVDFGKYNYNPKLSEKGTDSPELQQKVLSIINVKETSNYLFFNTNKIGTFVYDKKSHQITHAHKIKNINFGIDLWSHLAIEDSNHELIAYFCEMRMLQIQLSGKTSDNPIIKRIQKAKEDENPVLFLYKSKWH